MHQASKGKKIKGNEKYIRILIIFHQKREKNMYKKQQIHKKLIKYGISINMHKKIFLLRYSRVEVLDTFGHGSEFRKNIMNFNN